MNGAREKEVQMKTERMGDANIIPQKNFKKLRKLKSNHGCETLPGIPDQCGTPERPRSTRTTNTHTHTSRTKPIRK